MPIRLEGITLYTVKDIEELLGVGNSTVRRYIGEGRLTGTKMARRWYIPAQNLLDYFRQSSQEPPPELLERLQELEENLDKKSKRPRHKISLARIASGHAPRPPAPTDAPPPRTTRLPERVAAPQPADPATDIERLLAQARRLKEEAARLEALYITEGDAKE